MRITVQREALLAAAQRAALAVPSKPVKPVLDNILLQASHAPGDVSAPPDASPEAPNGLLSLTATDLEVGIRLRLAGVQVEAPGQCCLPADKLIDVLREARDGQLVLETEGEGEGCVIKGTTSRLRCRLPVADASSYPEFPKAPQDAWHELSAGTLRQLLRRVSFARADASDRYTMQGVCLILSGGTARAVATDGRRMAIASGLAVACGGHEPPDAPVLSGKLVTLAERALADDPEEPVRLSVRKDDAFVSTSTCSLYGRLLEGRFPDWQAVIPKARVAAAAAGAGALLLAVRQAATMCDRDGRKVRLEFGRGDLVSPGTLSLEALVEKGAGESHVELALEQWETALPGLKGADGGKEGRVQAALNLNPDYLAEFLKACPADAVLEARLADADGKRPVVLLCGEDWTYLVMPLT